MKKALTISIGFGIFCCFIFMHSDAEANGIPIGNARNILTYEIWSQLDQESKILVITGYLAGYREHIVESRLSTIPKNIDPEVFEKRVWSAFGKMCKYVSVQDVCRKIDEYYSDVSVRDPKNVIIAIDGMMFLIFATYLGDFMPDVE